MASEEYRFKVGDRFCIIDKYSFLVGRIGTIIEQKDKWDNIKAYVMLFKGISVKCHIEECRLISIGIKC